MSTKQSIKILIAVTGASGQIYAARTLQILKELEIATAEAMAETTAAATLTPVEQNIFTEIVFTDTAKAVWTDELPEPLPEGMLDNYSYYHPFASGSNAADAMIIIPASMGTIGRIAAGISNDLITRAADVMLKERRPLIIVPRETPLNLIHLENYTKLTQAGAIIAPASPSFYTHPKNIEELINTVALRVLTLAGIKNINLPRFLSNKN